MPQELDGLRRRLTDAEQAAEVRRQSLLAEKGKSQNAMGQLAIAREKASSTRWNEVRTHFVSVQVALHAQCRWSGAYISQLLQVKMAQARTEQQREVAANAAAQLAERDAQCAALQAQLDGGAHAGRVPKSGGGSSKGLRAQVAAAWLIATYCHDAQLPRGSS